MARYAFGNTLAAFKRSSTSVVEATTAGRFDSNFVSSAISLNIANGDFIESFPFIDASSVTTLYLHFELYVTSSSGIGNSGTLVDFYNSSGVRVATLNSTSLGKVRFQYWNGSSLVTAATSSTALPGPALYQFDIKIVCGASGTLDLWAGGTNILSTSGFNAAFDNIAMFRLLGGAQNGTAFISQVLAADYDLRDSKYMQKLADANGADTDGTGSYTDINETVLDDSTAIVLPAVSNKKTFTKPSTAVPAGYVISCMTVAARGRASGGTVTDGKLVVRSGGADYDSGSKSFTGGYEPRGHYLDNDPATGVPFTGAGYNSAEFGIKAA